MWYHDVIFFHFSFILIAFCLVSEAAKAQKAGGQLRAPLKQTLLDVPLNQDMESDTDSESDVDSDSTSSESSEVDSDTSSDMDTDTGTDTSDASAGSLVYAGNQAAGNPNPNVHGNLPNMQKGNRNQLNSGSNSGKNAGIAFAVLALVGLVVAGAMFAIRKYRRDLIPVIRIWKTWRSWERFLL